MRERNGITSVFPVVVFETETENSINFGVPGASRKKANYLTTVGRYIASEE